MVFVELNFMPMYEGQPGATEVMDFLSEHGFRLVDYYDIQRHRDSISFCQALFIK